MLYRLTAEIIAQIRGGTFPAQSIWIKSISCIKWKKEQKKEIKMHAFLIYLEKDLPTLKKNHQKYASIFEF